jgi:hypothetical protein
MPLFAFGGVSDDFFVVVSVCYLPPVINTKVLSVDMFAVIRIARGIWLIL